MRMPDSATPNKCVAILCHAHARFCDAVKLSELVYACHRNVTTAAVAIGSHSVEMLSLQAEALTVVLKQFLDWDARRCGPRLSPSPR